ncbi:MAG: VCBS repeat-containing protein [Bacteroidota bacterium]
MNVRQYVVACFALFTGMVSRAQGDTLKGFTYIRVDSTKQKWGDWDTPDWLRYFGLDAGDVDRDGNLDIVSGRYVYHNPGGSMQEPWRRTVLDDNVDAIFILDVDGDPYADIIAMALPKIYWYEATNMAGTSYQRKVIGQVPATSHVNSQGFEKAQLISGGKEEFVIAGNGNIYLVSLPKTKSATLDWKVDLVCENTSDEGIGVGDIDGDGDLDIAAGRRPTGEGEPKILVWFQNPGHTDKPWKETVVGQSEHPIDRVEIADMNGDQKADIVITEERYPGLEPDANFWWYSQEANNSWKRHKIVTQYSINNLDMADWDADGDIDLLTAEHKGPKLELQLWQNDGLGHFSKQVIDTGKENHLGTQFADVDNDGDLDIIGAGWDQHQYIHLWRNDRVASLKSGMLFREYPWIPKSIKDKGGFLRVGGRLGYSTNTDHFPTDGHRNGFIPLQQDLDLENAIGAEVFVERVQSHEDTKVLKIQFNDGMPIPLPEPSTLPDPATDYMFHSNIRVAVPLSNLREGKNNTFKLSVAKEQSWDWPQNLVYGLVLRVYYAPNGEAASRMRISGVTPRDTLGHRVQLSLLGEHLEDIVSVDYVGLYEDINIQGDGIYRQWQYRYHRGKRQYHIGTAFQAPFNITWDTEWIPDQQDPIVVTALAKNGDGLIWVLPMIQGLSLKRSHSVTLIKPYGQKAFWTTRNGEHDQHLDVPREVSKVDSARLFWNSWSPCYSNGIRLNDFEMPPADGLPCYDAFWHQKQVPINAIKKGNNTLVTLKTPLHNGKMVHGMEIQWPGIMLKLRQEKQQGNPVSIQEGNYGNRPHFIIKTNTAIYYYDIAGGGFSRILDVFGNDWIGYRAEPWNQYPASAASAFRGLPNLVFASKKDMGAGHPGHDKCVSEFVAPNKIYTRTKSGLWEWQWTFCADHAKLEILHTEDDVPYWFLYEGTPGGQYAPSESFYSSDLYGPQSDVPDFYLGKIDFKPFRWAYFGRRNVDATFFVAQLQKDRALGMMSYLGNTKKGASSPDGMTVFGFGRGPDTKPLLYGKHSFIIGMMDFEVRSRPGHQKMAKHINALLN